MRSVIGQVVVLGSQLGTGAVMPVMHCCGGKIMVIPAYPCVDHRNDGHAGTESDPGPFPHPPVIYFRVEDVATYVHATTQFYWSGYLWCFTIDPTTEAVELPIHTDYAPLSSTLTDTGCDTCMYEIHSEANYGGIGGLGCWDNHGDWSPPFPFGSISGSFTMTVNGLVVDGGLTPGTPNLFSQSSTDTIVFTTTINSITGGPNMRYVPGNIAIVNIGCKPLCITWTENGTSTIYNVEPGEQHYFYHQFVTLGEGSFPIHPPLPATYVITVKIECGVCT